MRKLMIGMAVVAVLALAVTPAIALKDLTIDGTTAEISPPVELEIEEYCRISIADTDLPIHVNVPGGESGSASDSGQVDYVVAANFDFQVTADVGGLNVTGTGTDPFKWDYSVDGCTGVNDGVISGGTHTLTADANEPAEETHTLVVACKIWDDGGDGYGGPLGFNDEAGDYVAGEHYDAGTMTLTVSAQP